MAQTYPAKSVIIGRMPRKRPEEFKTAFVKTFDSLDPFSADFPTKELEFPNVEKVVVKTNDPHLEYYLEGNDLVFAGISQISIDVKGTIVEFSANR